MGLWLDIVTHQGLRAAVSLLSQSGALIILQYAAVSTQLVRTGTEL